MTMLGGAGSIGSGAGGFKRLWRGVQAMFLGCIPAHALYFSSYEIIKSMCTDQQGGGIMMTSNDDHHHHQGGGGGQDENTHVGHDTLSPTQAMFAGTVATLEGEWAEAMVGRTWVVVAVGMIRVTLK